VILDEVAEPGGKTKRYLGTNWFIRPSFPAFVLNLLDYLGGSRDVLDAGSVRPGTPVTLEPPGPRAALRVRTPRGETVETPVGRSGRAAFTDTAELGAYEVQSGGKTLRRFAVNLFDPVESAIRPDPNPTIKVGDVKVKGETGWEPGRREIWKWLVLTGLVVLLVEWYIYIRRVY